MTSSFKLLDSVALLADMPSKRLVKGSVGTIVEVLDDDVFLVEFAEASGETIAFLELTPSQIMKLYFEKQLEIA